MESQYKKWVTGSYLVLSILVGYIIFALALKITGTYDLEARIRNVNLIVRAVSVLIGAIMFAVLYRNESSNQFMTEVVDELSRVTWPSTKDTASATFIVIVMVLASGMVLGLLDYFWTVLLKWVL